MSNQTYSKFKAGGINGKAKKGGGGGDKRKKTIVCDFWPSSNGNHHERSLEGGGMFGLRSIIHMLRIN